MPKNLSWVFHCFLIVQALTHNTAFSKKITHFDHSNKHEEILCWTVKLKDKNDITSHYQYRNFNIKNISPLSVSIGSTSHFTLEGFPDHYLLCHTEKNDPNAKPNFQGIRGRHQRIKEQSSELFSQLKEKIERDLLYHDGVEWFSQEVVRRRQKRAIDFDDPAFGQQWHLRNSHLHEMDINVTGVWERNITGRGVTVAVVDDGMEWKNPDLHGNYNFKGSWDLNDDDPDPSPSTSKKTNHHGTRCAGEIAAVANNNVCAVGVAYQAKVSGIRVLDGPMTDSLEAAAFNKKLQINDVYSCSWGPDDDGKTVDGPHIMAAKAMKYGVDFGRRGYGSIFVVASGNGGRHQDNCNYDGYANSIYTLTIGAVDEMGRMPFYAEECASMLGVTFSSGRSDERDIVTTDWTLNGGQGCTYKHTGTSAAAPLAAAMVALMLQARACLTWRDVQYLTILTAVKVDIDIAHWQKNGAGLYHSHKHGFGLLKAWRMVNAAKIWETVPWLTSYSFGEKGVRFKIPKGAARPLTVTHTVTEADIDGYGLFILENVQVTVTISHPHRGLLGVRLVSPSGTVSVIGAPRPLDNSTFGFQDWTFTTVRCWGETPTGKWTLIIMDTDSKGYVNGHLLKWQIILFGTPLSPQEFQNRRRKIEAAMSGEFLNDSFSLPCPPPPVAAKPDIPMSQKTLKILVLACAFCAVMALYESLEYAFCYNDEKKEHKAKMMLTARAQRLSSQDSLSNHVSPEDASESTGLLQSEEIPMETFTVRQESGGNLQDSDYSVHEHPDLESQLFSRENMDFNREEFWRDSDQFDDTLFDITSIGDHSQDNLKSGASHTTHTVVSVHGNHHDDRNHDNHSSSSTYPSSNGFVTNITHSLSLHDADNKPLVQRGGTDVFHHHGNQTLSSFHSNQTHIPAVTLFEGDLSFQDPLNSSDQLSQNGVPR